MQCALAIVANFGCVLNKRFSKCAIEIGSEGFPEVAMAKLDCLRQLPICDLSQCTPYTHNRASESIGQFNCVPDENRGERERHQQERKDPLPSHRNCRFPRLRRGVDQFGPHRHCNDIRDDEKDPMNTVSFQKTGLDFAINVFLESAFCHVRALVPG